MFGHIPEGYYKEQEEKRQKRRRDWLRDQFAMAALTGLLASQNASRYAVEEAYRIADDMLKERERKK